jgi:hypothetical protein
MKKNYKPCEVCKCGDCKSGTYRIDSWICPLFNKQICDICCYYDTQPLNKLKCQSLKCKYYKEGLR